MGLTDCVVKDLILKGSETCETVREMLTHDIEPEEEVLSQIRGRFTELDLLSRSEAKSIFEQHLYKKSAIIKQPI